MNEEFETQTLSVSCLNSLDEMKYGHCVRPTDPVLCEVNKKLDKILAILDKD